MVNTGYHRLIKILIVTVLTSLIGMSLGLGQVYAESKNNVNVPGAGNVGFAATTGWGSTWAYGQSTSSVTHAYQGAHIKFWHNPPGYTPTLQSQHQRDWYSSTGGTTNSIYASGSGDSATTNSGFYQSGGANYYTSYPHYTESCYAHWNSGTPC